MFSNKEHLQFKSMWHYISASLKLEQQVKRSHGVCASGPYGGALAGR